MTRSSDFNALLDRVMQNPEGADYAELRRAYMESDLYQPYGNSIQESMREIAQLENPEQALAKIHGLIDRYPLSIDAHSAAAYFHGQAGAEDKAGVHTAVFKGLIDAILASGDGKTPGTAYVVSDTREEYIILTLLEKDIRGQGLQQMGEEQFDVFTVASNSDQDEQIYFNVTAPLEWLSKRIGNQ